MPTTDVETYARRALRAIETRALHLDRANWPEHRAEVLGAARTATHPAQLHPLLRQAVRHAGGAHSGLIEPGRRSLFDAQDHGLPTARLIGTTAVLSLPACPAGARRADTYLRAAAGALHHVSERAGERAGTAGARGWVVDLRGNLGGSMWPMLAAVAPLLGGDGRIGAFVDRDGHRTPWRLSRGCVGTARWALRRRALARCNDPRPLPGPVLVLTDERTASSGEAVVVAFRGAPGVRSCGRATHGFSTANDVVVLPDGATLLITCAALADRTGTVHAGRLHPDHPVEDTARTSGPAPGPAPGGADATDPVADPTPDETLLTALELLR